jgi:hypothetical protein
MARNALLALLLAVGLMPFARPAAADTVVVCAQHSPITSLSREEAEQVYLGRTRELTDGIAVTPVDLPIGPVRDHFYQTLTGKNPSQIRAYWSRLVFTGRALPPREATSAAEALAWLDANPSFIAYVPGAEAGEAVRVLLHLP